MGWVEFDATWWIAGGGAVWAARASAAPNAKDNPTTQTIMLAKEVRLEPLSQR
jgi:hypothetical protein